MTGVVAARRRQRTGAAVEDLVQHSLNAASVRGRAHITKRATPVRVQHVGKNGRVTGHFERSPGVDYHGVLRGGRAVYLEVKSCHKGTFPLSSIEPEQWEEMARARRLGAACVLLVFWWPNTARGRALIGGRTHAWCVVWWSTVARLRAAGVVSIDSEQLGLCAVPASSEWTQELECIE